MKISRAFALVLTALILGILAARWCPAESARQPSSKESALDDSIGLKQFVSFVAYLEETKQTNALQQFNEYTTVFIASKEYADLGVELAILERLRDGRTNDAYELLETRLSGHITGFVAGYRELPPPLREKMSLKAVQKARDYRKKFPFKHHYPQFDEIVAAAFKILDEKTATAPAKP